VTAETWVHAALSSSLAMKIVLVGIALMTRSGSIIFKGADLRGQHRDSTDRSLTTFSARLALGRMRVAEA